MADTDDGTLWVRPSAAGRGALSAGPPGASVWPLEALVRTLAALAPVPRRALDGMGSWLAVAVAATDGRALSVQAVEQVSGLADAVQAARRGRVRARALQRVAEQLEGAPAQRLGALARALGAYEALLQTRALADTAGQWDDARAALASAVEWPQALQGFQRLHLCLHPPLPAVALEALVALAQLAERVGRSVTFEVPAAGEGSLDAALEPLFSAFEAHPELSPSVLAAELPHTEAPLARAVARLGLPAAQAAPAYVFSAAHAGAAAAVVAQQARAAVQAGASPAACAVLVPDAATAEAVAAALTAAGLPLGARPRRTLGSTAPGRLGVLLARLEDAAFPREEVGWLLGSGLLPGVRPQAPRGAAALLERAGVRDEALGGGGGQGAYRVRLEALAQRGGRTPRRPEALQLLSACEALFSAVRTLPAQATLSAHLEAWQHALSALGFWEAPEVGEFPEDGPADAACRALGRQLQAREAWRALLRGVRGALKALGTAGPLLQRAGFAAFLAEAADGHPLPAELGHPGGLAVLLYEEAIGRGPFQWLGAPALAEGRFPRPVRRAGALTDVDRQRVNRALGRDAFPLRYGSADVRPVAALALDGWRLGAALGRAGAAALGFARDDGFQEVAGPAGFLEAFARSAGVPREDVPDAAVVPLVRAASERELREAVAWAGGQKGTDRLARALLPRLQEGWLQQAQALGAMEAERVRAFVSPELPSGRFSGAVTDGDLAPALAQRYAYGPDAPLSASTLGKFGRCAFQGFAHTSLRLEPPEAPGEALDARGQGSFWHAVLESLVPRLLSAGLVGRPFRDVPSALLEAALDDGARVLAARFSPGHPRLFSLARERARWMVRRVLDAAHHGVPFEGLKPVEVETTFGRASAEEGWREVRLEAALPAEADVCLTGTVDRLDAGPSGVAVLDYKANRRREAARELLVTDFQLPFYLWAVRARGERRPLRAGWLVLKSGEFQEFEALAGQSLLLAMDGPTRAKARQEGRANLANAVHHLVGRSRAGDFGARPLDCGFCPYGAVCRIGARRKEAGR